MNARRLLTVAVFCLLPLSSFAANPCNCIGDARPAALATRVLVEQQMHVQVERATHAQVGHVILALGVLQMLAPGAHLMHGPVVQPILALVAPQTLGPVVHVTQDPVGHVIRVQAEDGTVRPYVDKKELNT
jgi:hypothetical protein